MTLPYGTMPQRRDEAVCIRHWDFSETSQTVSLFGREHGLLRGLAKGAKREKSAFCGGIELLTRGEILALVKPGRDLATLTEWDLTEIFPALSRHLRAHQAGLYMADLVQHLLTESDPHPALFDALIEALRGLEMTDEIDVRLLQFQWTILNECGYRPVLDRDALTGEPLIEKGATLAFSPQHGGTVADSGAGDRWRVRRETIELLRHIEDANGNGNGEARKKAFQNDSETVGRANRLLAAYIRAILDRELTTMRLLFGELRV